MKQHLTRLPMMASLLVLAACSGGPRPYRDATLEAVASDSSAMRVPVANVTPLEPVLECLGDRLRDARLAPLLIGIGVTDPSEKSGVEAAMMVRSALNKIARRGAMLQATSMGVMPGTKPMQYSAEEKLREAHKHLVRVPDLVIEGGITSVLAGARQEQRSAGLAGRDGDAGRAGSRSIDQVHLSLFLKRYDTGADLPGAHVDLKVVHQSASSSTDLGVYVAWRIDARKQGAGLRLARSASRTESPDDAIRAGIEAGVVMLLAQAFNVDLGACPSRSPEPPLRLDQAAKPTDPIAQFQRGDERERVRVLQQLLTLRGYAVGGIDGVVGPKTEAAMARAEQDYRLPPSAGRPTLQLCRALVQRAPAAKPR